MHGVLKQGDVHPAKPAQPAELPPQAASGKRLALAGPRLLPITILAMGALLLLKVVDLAVAVLPYGAQFTQAVGNSPLFAWASAANAQENGQKPAEPGKPNPAAGKEKEKEPQTAEEPLAPGATRESASTPIGDVAAQLGPVVSESERKLLTDLRHRDEDLNRREAALNERDTVLAAAEARLNARLDELKVLQAKLENLDKARQAQAEANWRGLVKVYETMKPRDAAAICNDLDYDVLIPVLDRMKESKAAALLAAMDPVKAREATALLAKKRTQATTLSPAADSPVTAQPVNALVPPASPPPAAPPPASMPPAGPPPTGQPQAGLAPAGSAPSAPAAASPPGSGGNGPGASAPGGGAPPAPGGPAAAAMPASTAPASTPAANKPPVSASPVSNPTTGKTPAGGRSGADAAPPQRGRRTG